MKYEGWKIGPRIQRLRKKQNMTAEDLDFSYELLDSVHRYARAGGPLHLQGYVTNISENTYAFSGDTVPEVHLVLYCQKGEQRYVISHEPIAVPTAGAAASGSNFSSPVSRMA